MTIQHDIKNWYAIGATPQGKGILEGLGFCQVTTLDTDAKGYKLETRAEPVKLIGMYLKSLDESKHTT